MATPLLLVNSIGLTGSEILTAALARHPALAMLPGQNFIGFGNCLYRQHDYASLSPPELFQSLAEEYLMTSGRVWSGLTKDMKQEERAAYDRDAHRTRFVAQTGKSAASLLDHARSFALTYFADGVPQAAYLGFFGQNLVLSHGRELEGRSDFRMLGCVNRIEYWLANISQRMTWDCMAAAKFWIVNHLLLELFAKRRPQYLAVDLERLVDERAVVLGEIWRHLGLDSAASGAALPGFIRFDAGIFSALRSDADLVGRIYGDSATVRMARTLADWAPAFLADERNIVLLERYRDYWNSTSHTNFDWIGPIEDEIVERARSLSGCRDGGNRSLDFYHRYHRLNSLNHSEPQVLEPQMLGCLEDEIVVPLMPFFIKICVEHLTNLARIAERQAHSYRSLRGSSLYAKLAGAEGRRAIERLRLGERMTALEEQIDRAEAKVGHAGARRAPGA
jgi:hypothetical protein